MESDAAIELRQKLSAGRRTLAEYTGKKFYYGIKTGLNEAFVIDRGTRDRFVQQHPASGTVLKPFMQGTHLRPFYIEDSDQFLITLKSSGDHAWVWSDSDGNAETAFAEAFPPVYAHLQAQREVVSKRSDQGRFWWELRSCAYWEAFEQPKIVWPDISKLPRFSMDTENRYLGNTGYIIPGGDYYLLGILSSWATWFFISKTAQPLRLRGDRWQYRLIAQFMEQVPVPDAPEAERQAIADLARVCSAVGDERYRGQVNFQRRLLQAFAVGGAGQLNQKAEAWWNLSLNQLGDALKQSFKLPANPMKNPRAADEWEPYLQEKRDENARLTSALADAEAELNDRVYRLFNLTADEIKLLQTEVEH
jgi:hypothetical protein